MNATREDSTHTSVRKRLDEIDQAPTLASAMLVPIAGQRGGCVLALTAVERSNKGTSSIVDYAPCGRGRIQRNRPVLYDCARVSQYEITPPGCAGSVGHRTTKRA